MVALVTQMARRSVRSRTSALNGDPKACKWELADEWGPLEARETPQCRRDNRLYRRKPRVPGESVRRGAEDARSKGGGILAVQQVAS